MAQHLLGGLLDEPLVMLLQLFDLRAMEMCHTFNK